MIKPEFSEFTFGYAFTENFTNGWIGGDVRSVPIFPSLIQEGRLAGGYDVEIPTRAEPILFQFKIPQIVRRRSQFLPPNYSTPYYRMHLEPGAKSTQHRALLQHARRGRSVFYVSPCFDRLDILDNRYRVRAVPNECIYFRPNEIGVLDDRPHFVAYQTNHGAVWLFSTPKEIATRPPGNIREEISAIARSARPTLNRDEYFAELSRDLVESIAESVELTVERNETEEERDRPSYVYEELRRFDSVELLSVARSTEMIADPVERFVTLATFVLDCHVILVGSEE